MLLLLLSVVAIIILIIVLLVRSGEKEYRQKKERQERLQREYHEALQGTDKQEALARGRKYFASLYNTTVNGLYTNTLALADEQRLANDIATMKTETIPLKDELKDSISGNNE